jgi:hypothetical protein
MNMIYNYVNRVFVTGLYRKIKKEREAIKQNKTRLVFSNKANNTTHTPCCLHSSILNVYYYYYNCIFKVSMYTTTVATRGENWCLKI